MRLNERQKLQMAVKDSPANRLQHQNDYFTMDAKDFVALKNGGKRTGSNKLTDPVTGQNFVLDQRTGKFHTFDKTRPGNQGDAVPDLMSSRLHQQLGNGELMDRRRPDRNNARHELLPGDVAPYSQDLTLRPGQPGSTMTKASGVPAAFNTNRDHVPSGESLNRRNTGAPNPAAAYNQGVTVAIPDDRTHKAHSLTYGSRQKAKDTVTGQPATVNRVDYDANNPASAFHRDMDHLLNKTQGQNLYNPQKDSLASQTVKDRLDMNNPDSRLNLIGSYRYAGSTNAKLNQNYGPLRGYDPQSPGQTAAIHQTQPPNASRKYDAHQFTYTNAPGQTQGQMISNSLRDRLVNEGFAEPVPELGPRGTKRPAE